MPSGFPLRPSDGRPVDNLGRPIDAKGQPIDEDGDLLRDPDGLPLPPAPRTRSATRRGSGYGFEAAPSTAPGIAAAAARVRKLWDCCSLPRPRINGDAALTATATAAARSSASCTTRPRSHADRLSSRSRRRGARDRPHRRLVALRVLDGGDDRAQRARRRGRTTSPRCATSSPARWRAASRPSARSPLVGELVHGAADGRLCGGRRDRGAAAVAEARGTRIVPQVRRQLPEHWRRAMPMPLAAFLYGILLGLGFTTFVLSFGVWALAGISFALGDRSRGGDRRRLRGRARDSGRRRRPGLRPAAGIRSIEADDERPALYRGVRLGDAVALGALRGGAGRDHRHGRAAEPAALGRADPSAPRARHGLPARGSARDPAVGGQEPEAARRRAGDRRALSRCRERRRDRHAESNNPRTRSASARRRTRRGDPARGGSPT